jgi:hypothetical protein
MVLLLSTVMLVTIDASQNYVSAQYDPSILEIMPLIPVLEPSDSEEESLSSNDVSNNDNTGSTNFHQDPLSNEEADELKDELLSNNDVSNNDNSDDSDSQQDTSSTEEDELVDEDALTNPLGEQIRNRVNGTLSTFGSTIP